MIQKVEIEVDVPDGWRPTGDFEYAVPYEGAEPAIIGRLLLEKIEPKRESRWFCAVRELCDTGGFMSLASALKCIDEDRSCIERRDYEDGKLVAVTLEPEGEP